MSQEPPGLAPEFPSRKFRNPTPKGCGRISNSLKTIEKPIFENKGGIIMKIRFGIKERQKVPIEVGNRVIELIRKNEPKSIATARYIISLYK